MNKNSLVLFALMAINIQAYAKDLVIAPKNIEIINNESKYEKETVEIAQIDEVRLRESLESTYIYDSNRREQRFKACYELTRVNTGTRHEWDYLPYQALMNLKGTVSGNSIILNDYFDIYQKHNDDLMEFFSTNLKKRIAKAEEYCTGQFYGELLVRGTTTDGRKFNVTMGLRYNSHGDKMVELGFGSRNQKLSEEGDNSNIKLIAYKNSTTFESQWAEADPANSQVIYKMWTGPKN